MTTSIFNAGTPVYPDMAVNSDGTDNNVTDPTSGQNNVVAASGAKQASGWNFTEKPARNVMNWLHRLTTQWIRWLYANAWHADTVFYGHGEGVGGTTPVKITLSSINAGLTKANCMIVSCMVFQEDGQTWDMGGAFLTTETAVDYLEINWAGGTSGCTYKFIVKKIS
jgi:hypothetical protein